MVPVPGLEICRQLIQPFASIAAVQCGMLEISVLFPVFPGGAGWQLPQRGA